MSWSGSFGDTLRRMTQHKEAMPGRWERIAVWWERRLFGDRVPAWAVGVAAIALVGIGASAASKHDDPATPGGDVEACESIADPANVNLHPSDWRRIGHWTQREMILYVTTHCPEQLDKVT